MTTQQKYLVYVKKFKAKESLPVELQEGRVYNAIDDGDELFNVIVGDKALLVHKTLQSGPAFEAEIVKIDEKNINEFQYKEEDVHKIEETFIRPIIEKADKEFNDQQRLIMNTFSSDLADLSLFDGGIVEAIADVTHHIRGTFNDKYEDGDPAIDLYGLMRESPHGAGFNVGNAAKYVGRYLTTGYPKSNNIEDLYKAIHYLLFEINRRKDAE